MWMLRRDATRPQSGFGARSDLQSRGYPQSAAHTPSRAAPAATSIVHDLPDGGDATAALWAAAKTTVNFSGSPRSCLDGQGRTDVEVAQYIAGTDNHGARYSSGVVLGTPHRYPICRAADKGKKQNLHVFQFAAGLRQPPGLTLRQCRRPPPRPAPCR